MFSDPDTVVVGHEAPTRTFGRRFALWSGFLLAVCVVSGWSALASLAEITPALFPGQQLTAPVSLPVFEQAAPLIPPILKVNSPGPESVFNRPIVILAVGIDSRPDTTDGLTTLNTDTIMLANIDPVTKTVKVLSIPRDLLIDIKTRNGTYSDRINASFAAGVRNGGGVSEGMAQLEGDIERNFGVKIDYWVQVDFRGAEELIDAIGGVDVTIPEDLAIEQWWYSDDDIHGRWLSFPPGPQHLDGYEAVAFARLRALDDDFHRIRRQQIILRAAVLKAFEGGLLDHPLDAWDAYSHAVATNVPASRIPGYALLVKQVNARISTYSLADPVDGVPTMTGVRLRNGAAVLKARPENVEYWFDLVFGRHEGDGSVDLREGEATPGILP